MSKKVFNGKVVSDKNNKTLSVLVERGVMHQRYKKQIIRSKKYLVHDENNDYKVGDLVKIIEHRPFSKRKKWVVVSQIGGTL
jgi:small subunit ribosomal protein S17